MQFQHFPYLSSPENLRSTNARRFRTPFNLSPLGPSKLPVVPIVGLGPESISKQKVEVNLDLRIDDLGGYRLLADRSTVYGAVDVRYVPIRVRSTNLVGQILTSRSRIEIF
jgi:hypothetical protein